MASRPALFPNFTPLPPHYSSKHLANSQNYLPFNPRNQLHKRHSPLPALASSLPLPINVDYLEREFGGRGVSFEGIGDDCVVKLGLDNGSLASLVLPSGLITSYKPHMWFGSTLEVLHTSVSEGESGEAVIQGGVSMEFKCISDGGLPWSLTTWALNDVRGSSEDSLQVELISMSSEDMVEIKCLITLREDLLASELTMTNLKESSLQLLGSIISHLTVSTPDATYALGLLGSNYRNMQPMMSEFSIIPPDFSGRTSTVSSQSWVPKALQELFPLGDGRDEKDNEAQSQGGETEEMEGEEDDDYAQLTEKMSRVYTSAPREFTLIDRGRRNSVVIRRSGFDEFYIFSPGSNHEWYGKYAYICIGPSAMLAPIVLGPGDVWNGGQYLYNPSL